MTDLEITLLTLQKWADNPSLIADDARAKALISKIHREGSRGAKKAGRDARNARDRAKIEATGRVALAAPSPRALPAPPNEESAALERARVCPTCRAVFSQLHPFYHAYCPDCASFNWKKGTKAAI